MDYHYCVFRIVCNYTTMKLLDKLKKMVNPSTSDMFDGYVSYFKEKGTTIKVGKTIKVTENGETHEYSNWVELNEKYKLFPTLEDKLMAIITPYIMKNGWGISSNLFGDVVVTDKEDKRIGIYRNLFDFVAEQKLEGVTYPTNYERPREYQVLRLYFRYAWGSKDNSKYIADEFNLITASNIFKPNMFTAPDRFYYINSWGHLCSTKDKMILDIFESDPDWLEIETPKIIKFTKQEIADKLGMNVNDFVIEDGNENNK